MAETQRSRYPTGAPGLSVGLGWLLDTVNSATFVWHNDYGTGLLSLQRQVCYLWS